MNKLYLQLQSRLLPVLLVNIWCGAPYKSWCPTSTSRYGAEPHIKHGLQYRSDTSDRVVGDISHIPSSAHAAVNAFP
eukprot:5482467-Pleurochrysis_carterae.AAC.1